MAHETVLLEESVQALAVKAGGTYVDGTFGRGGHSKAILAAADNVTLVAFDKDEAAIERGRKELLETADGTDATNDNIILLHESFAKMGDAIKALDIKAVDGILLDLGFSSDQLEDGRGLTFQKDEPLLMFLGTGEKSPEENAMDVVNRLDAGELENILREYGEEKHARLISEAIVKERRLDVITTTGRLVKIIENAAGRWYKKEKIHPATRTFQALRIYVNDELGELERALKNGFEMLAPKGRFAVISFHSLEDRIVKNFFKEKATEKKGTLIVKKPMIPTNEEVSRNRRSRSAKLRIIEKN
ncbi:MAG: 16S rRNA (cytosine(1402)-N(4))-methyltransferase RsmH [Candidatus Pacebacteria bacterium]|nr:16S rRNA (cytosine(1402)-N(4))-methyltransferase RsmH [Candidatus Paceibacterota bacterium]MBP9851740.1 16S rRNA (cytosine(1402)-N(4))-methyltransferase RsmH [Candidatus Paceibacterota bacterium]